MSVWTKASEKMPPLGKEVLILYKDKDKPLDYKNLYYATAHRTIRQVHPSAEPYKDWSFFIEYQENYEVVYWAKLYDMPLLK